MDKIKNPFARAIIHVAFIFFSIYSIGSLFVDIIAILQKH